MQQLRRASLRLLPHSVDKNLKMPFSSSDIHQHLRRHANHPTAAHPLLKPKAAAPTSGGHNPPILSPFRTFSTGKHFPLSDHYLATAGALALGHHTFTVRRPFPQHIVRHHRTTRILHHGHSHGHNPFHGHSHGRAGERAVDHETAEKDAMHITRVGLGWNIALSVSKGIAGVLGNSVALVADAFHSLSDLFSDFVTMLTVRHASKPPDEDHPYGHGRIEDLGTLVVALSLVATGGGIGYHALSTIAGALSGDAMLTPSSLALIVALLSVLIKEGLFQATMTVAKKHKSRVIEANAWHHRSDAMSSLLTMVGIFGAIAQYPLLDPLAGIVVAGLIAKQGVTMGVEVYHDITDRSIDAALTKSLAAIINSCGEDGVLGFSKLRGRRMGRYMLVDVNILVPKYFSVSAAHQASEVVRMRVLQQHPEINEMLIHVDVENDGHEEGMGKEADDEGVNKTFKRVGAFRSQNKIERHIRHVFKSHRFNESLLKVTSAGVDRTGVDRTGNGKEDGTAFELDFLSATPAVTGVSPLSSAPTASFCHFSSVFTLRDIIFHYVNFELRATIEIVLAESPKFCVSICDACQSEMPSASMGTVVLAPQSTAATPPVASSTTNGGTGPLVVIGTKEWEASLTEGRILATELKRVLEEQIPELSQASVVLRLTK